MRPVQNGRNQVPRANQIFFWALTGDCKSLRSALEGGVNVNSIDPVTTDTPLMIACRKGHPDVVRLCLEFGGKNDPHPEFGQTALHASISEQKIECARVLLDVAAASGADHNISNLADPSGQTPLHTAAYIGSAALIELLLHHGAQMSLVDVQGQTALHLCASSGVKSCVAMLLDHGGDELIDLQDKGGHTPLHHASFHGRLDCVRLLLETAADVNIRNHEGLTSYNLASAQGHHQIGLLLLEYRDIHQGVHNTHNMHSNIHTPNKSTRGPSPLYQTPPSLSKYRPDYPFTGTEYVHSEATPDDAPLHEVRLNILSSPQQGVPPHPYNQHNNHQGHPNNQRASTLSLSLPVNPMSSMYGTNNGLESMDSIGSFLPRPHTVSSPVVSARNSARNSPTVKGNFYLQGSARDDAPVSPTASGPHAPSNLTQMGIAQHNRSFPQHSNSHNYANSTLQQAFGLSGKSHHSQFSYDSFSNGQPSPRSPGGSEPASSADGGNNNGYKVLTKPSLSRQSSISAGGDQVANKIQLFDGIQTYTKASIIPTHSRTNSGAVGIGAGSSIGNGVYGEEPNPYTQYQDTTYHSAPNSNGSSNSVTNANAGLPQTTHFTARDGVNPILQKQKNSTFMSVANASNGSNMSLNPENYAEPYHYSTNNTTTSTLPAPASPSVTRRGFGSEMSEAAQDVGPDGASEQYEYADPIEIFTYLELTWHVYVTEHNDIYYLDMVNEHSQWDDPRVHGIVHHIDAPTESPSHKSHTPPKSPSPKGLEKTKTSSFHFNPHSYTVSAVDTPERSRDIKPIKLNWEVGADDTNKAGKKGKKGTKTHNNTASSTSDGESSEDEAVSAVQVRYPRSARTNTNTNTNSSGASSTLLEVEEESSEIFEENNGTRKASVDEEDDELDLSHIHAHLDFESSVGGGESESGAAADANGAANSRIKALTKHFEKGHATSKTVATINTHTALATQGSNSVHTPVHSPHKSNSNTTASTPTGTSSNNRRDAASPTTAPLVRKVSLEGSAVNGTTRTSDTAATIIQPTPISPPRNTTNTTNTAATTAISSISREEAEPYIQQLLKGASLQDTSERMDREGRSQAFKRQVLAWADEALILGGGVSSEGDAGKTTPINKPPASSSAMEVETLAQLKTDPVLAKYAKMLSMGVSPGNVLMKLKMENVALADRNRLMRAAGHEEEVDPAAASTSAASAAPVVETVEQLKHDGVLAKFAKMVAMGVPAGSVLMKMKIDNIEVTQRNRLMRAAGHEEEEDPSVAATNTTNANAAARRPSASMQNLHWNTLPADKLKHSIWSTTSTNTITTIAEQDLAELERLFGNNSNAASAANGSFATTRSFGAQAENKNLQLKLLEKKRAQNIVIGLNPFKSLGTHVVVLKALCSLNDMEGRITADHIDNFRGLLPTEAEMKRIDKINGSKHPAELFLQAAMMFYPELPHRLTCFSACLNFESNCEAVLGRSRRLIDACNQVLASNNLAKLLQRMLVVGNIMNEGTRRGGASGFTLDSLLKMVNTKGTDKKTSVLDYVVKSLYDHNEEGVLLLLEDLSLVEDTAKLSGSDIIKEYSTIRSSLDSLQQAYEYNQNKTQQGSNVFNSPTAKTMIDAFSTRLEQYLSSFQGQMQECEKHKTILSRKMDDIVKYFGEDSRTCDTGKIFGTLHEFLRAVAFSKAAVEWRLYRSQSASNG